MGGAGFPTALNPMSAMSAAAMSAAPVQQPFANGSLGGPAAAVVPPGPPTQQQPGQSLMSLLQTSGANASLNATAFAPLGNGTVPQAACGTRAQVPRAASNHLDELRCRATTPRARAARQAAFRHAMPPAPHCQMPQNTVMSGSAAFAPPNHGFAPSAPRGPPTRGAQSAAPKALSSASDYANAAQNYKPPPTRAASSATSISRKPEISSKTTSQPAAHKDEWECPRCTFLNNSALWECEMCGFERAGKQEQQGEAYEDGGWHTASSSVRRSVTNLAMASGKSKAQSKNEKRRAKKRGDP